MKIVKLVDRDLTENEIESINRFRSYTDGVSFACLRERVIVMIYDEESKDIEKMKSNALGHMSYVLNHHPDFSTWDMDDGYKMVELLSGVYGLSCKKGMHSMDDYLLIRNECLKACEDGEIIAIAYEEEEE